MNRCSKCQDMTAPCNDCINRNLALLAPPSPLPEYKFIAATQTPHRCPVCGGNGLVSAGFYMQTSGTWSGTSTASEQCRSCTGTGIVWR